MQERFQVRVQNGAFDLGAECERMRLADAGIGAIASFVGVVRELNDGVGVNALELEHYPGMTEKVIEGIVDEARSRWPLNSALVVHRVGLLRPTDPIVLVICTSAHRAAAFESCAFIMDFLKTRAPFWKKESTPDGARWVEARDSDSAAARGWEGK
ncbi:MAG: molybdopterin synthase catalytic subunit MoaE [Gammaproteobacteria bacterium]